MSDVTDDDLQRWERLCESATPAPWWFHNPDDSACMNMYCVTSDGAEPNDEHDLGNCVAVTLMQRPGIVAPPDDSPPNEWRFEENAYFIAESRTALPRLIAAYRAAMAENARLCGDMSPLESIRIISQPNSP